MKRQLTSSRSAVAFGVAVLAGASAARADIVGFAGFAPVNMVAPATNTVG